jgi:hypothetical protein
MIQEEAAMKDRTAKKILTRSSVACALLVGWLMASVPTTAQTQPVATPPYKISVFAMNPNGISQPDSIVRWRDNVIVGFQNHVAKDGTDGKSSTIVEFSLSGKVKRMFQVPGHNDGCAWSVTMTFGRCKTKTPIPTWS